MVQITVKDVDEKTFAELKAEAARQKMKVGRLLSFTVEMGLQELKKPKLPLASIKAFKWGKGTEHVSEEVDRILYR
jgi:hypothetical protein